MAEGIDPQILLKTQKNKAPSIGKKLREAVRAVGSTLVEPCRDGNVAAGSRDSHQTRETSAQQQRAFSVPATTAVCGRVDIRPRDGTRLVAIDADAVEVSGI